MQNEQVISPIFKTFAFIDLETSGLPSLEYSSTKITQISITACSVEHIQELKDKDAIPRVLHKLSLCLNPRKLIKLEVSDITGLTNELLQNERKFDEGTVDLINNFLTHLQQPVCLVAHNGDRFDYPIIKSHCNLLKKPLLESVFCCDSLTIFRKIDEVNEENTKMLINGYKMTCWEKFKDDQIFLMATEILDVGELLKNYDSDENTMTIEELEDDFINRPSNSIKSEPDNEDMDIRERQRQNETTPNKPVRNEEKKAPSKTPGPGNNKRQPSPRVLFPSTSDQPKKDYPKGYYSLREIYKRIFGVYPENSHDSDADVLALLKCVCACKKEFLDIASKVAYNFCDVKDL